MIFNHKHEILLKNIDKIIPADDIEEQDTKWTPINSLLFSLSEPVMENILQKYQIWNWKRRNKFCGVCGATTLLASDGSKECTVCKEKFFPAQFPVVIVLVKKENTILLAHNSNFPEGLYSVIAGFIDIGETCEQAIKREIREEVGIEIKNIKYFGSQNWGFSTSLMLAFTAEYDSGEICVDGVEISHAGWYSKGNLPDLPPEVSIGYRLIKAEIE